MPETENIPCARPKAAPPLRRRSEPVTAHSQRREQSLEQSLEQSRRLTQTLPSCEYHRFAGFACLR
eukprot:9375491-Pyramimonas_sp.AAC.1